MTNTITTDPRKYDPDKHRFSVTLTLNSVPNANPSPNPSDPVQYTLYTHCGY